MHVHKISYPKFAVGLLKVPGTNENHVHICARIAGTNIVRTQIVVRESELSLTFLIKKELLQVLIPYLIKSFHLIYKYSSIFSLL